MNEPRWEHVPALEALEDAAETMRAEVERLLEVARDQLRRVQDIDAELEAGIEGVNYGACIAARHLAAHRLRALARQLTRAHCELVPPSDERYVAAQRVLGWTADADRADSPWRGEAA